MGFDIRIRTRGPLVIPADSGYEPPHPTMPEYVRFSPSDMTYLCAFMAAAGAVDPRITLSSKRKECAKGKVPIYKFCFNDGFVVTAREAALIAEAMGRQDLFALEFLTAHFPRFDPAKYDRLGRTRELVALWIAFNRVAAANNGYTVQ